MGCITESGQTPQESNLTSKSAVFLELSFTGQVVAPTTTNTAQWRKSVVSQLFYMSGELDKVHGGHGRFGFVELSDMSSEPHSEGLELVRYQAKLAVAWPKYSHVPERYRVVVPLRVDSEGLSAFNNKYKGSCGKAKYGADNFWYDFEPIATACEMASEDVLDTEAAVAPHPDVTTDKRPEYERFWDDGVFRAVIVHGTDSASSKDPDDLGVREYLDLQRRLEKAYPEAKITSGETTYAIYDDWTLEATVEGYGGVEGKLIVTTLLTSSLKHIGSDFDERFGALSADADLITYGGHSGLSKNIKALAAKETVKPQHYQVYFIDGCSTFAYLDTTLADRRIATNGEELDPHGTKYLDVIINAQPAPWWSGADSQWTILSHLAGTETTSYLDILDDLTQSATPVVAGEQDNPSVTE